MLQTLQQQLALQLTNTELRIRRSARAKRLRVSISPVGEVEVVVPERVSSKDVQHFIRAREAWISHNKRRIEALRSTELNALMPERIILPAINEDWQVSYKKGPAKIEFEKNPVTNVGSLCLSNELESQFAHLLQRWLTSSAKSYLLPWLKNTSEEIGIKYSTATVRGQKTRWASCSARKNISLNRCMLFLAPEQVRYLMVHELCHTRHMNHSRKFWELVERFTPDYLVQERLVNEACYKLPKWAY